MPVCLPQSTVALLINAEHIVNKLYISNNVLELLSFNEKNTNFLFFYPHFSEFFKIVVVVVQIQGLNHRAGNLCSIEQ